MSLTRRVAAALAGVMVGIVGAPASGYALPARPPGTPGVPTSSVVVAGFTQIRYCVKNYAPTSKVAVAAPGGGTSMLRTSNVGAGCTKLPFEAVCGAGAGLTVVATGTGADGNPATSSATLADSAGAPSCPPTTRPHALAAGGGTSTTTIGLAAGAGGAVVVAGLAVLWWRRRRRRAAG